MDFIILLPILVFSVILHEVSHGIVAHKFGDDTAYLSGRLTLNPIPHLDMIGSFLFPLICILMKAPVFGWAKPVPINPNQFNHYRSGIIWVSLAGPLANLLVALGCVAILSFSVNHLSGSAIPVQGILFHAILLNLVLSIFNLIPIPPLDGSRILSVLLPTDLSARYDSIEPYGFIILMVLVGTGILGMVMNPVVHFLYSLLLGIAGF